MLKAIKLGLTLLLFMPMFSAQAEVTEGLFSGSVEVNNQSVTAQANALKEAFKQVLVKVSGNRALLTSEKMQRHINNADDFLQSYQFDFQEEKTFYIAHFSPQRVENAIRVAGFPIWGKRRPDALAWIAIEDNRSAERYLLGEGDSPQLTQVVQHSAKQRGIEVDLPLLDLTDLQKLNVYDVWSSNAQSIQRASERYQVDFVLSARIYYQSQPRADNDPEVFSGNTAKENQEPKAGHRGEDQRVLPSADGNVPLLVAPRVNKADVWIGQWLLLHRGNVKTGLVDAKSLDLVVNDIIEALADEEAQYYAIDVSQLTDEDRQATLKVDNINSLTDYHRLTDLLAGLTVVVKADLLEIKGDQGTYQMELLGKQKDLLEALKLDSRLKAKTNSYGQVEDDMHFIWGQ